MKGLCGKSCAEEEDESIVYGSSSFMLRAALKQLNLNMQAQSVRLGVDAQLLLVATTGVVRWELFWSCC